MCSTLFFTHDEKALETAFRTIELQPVSIRPALAAVATSGAKRFSCCWCFSCRLHREGCNLLRNYRASVDLVLDDQNYRAYAPLAAAAVFASVIHHRPRMTGALSCRLPHAHHPCSSTSHWPKSSSARLLFPPKAPIQILRRSCLFRDDAVAERDVVAGGWRRWFTGTRMVPCGTSRGAAENQNPCSCFPFPAVFLVPKNRRPTMTIHQHRRETIFWTFLSSTRGSGAW